MSENDFTPDCDNQHYDIAVIGCGVAGLCMAYAAAQKGFKTALIGAFNPQESGRTVALFTQSTAFLKHVDLWNAVENIAYPLKKLRIIDDSKSIFTPPSVTFDAHDIDLNELGYSFELHHLQAALYDQVKKHPLIDHYPHMLTHLEVDIHSATLTLDDGTCVYAKLVIGADGRNSRVRECAQINVKTWSYPQVALTVGLQHTYPHRHVSTEMHTRYGPFTWVPLNEYRSGLVWLTSPEHGKELSELSDDALATCIRDQAKGLLGNVKCEGARQLVPMRGLNATRLTGLRVALIAETAHAFPPIGAQGLNMSLADVFSLEKCLKPQLSDLDQSLKAYEKARLRDIHLRTTLVDGFNRALLAPWLPVDLMRGAGLLALGYAKPLRKAIMRAGLNL